jgi:hypothetical protein
VKTYGGVDVQHHACSYIPGYRPAMFVNYKRKIKCIQDNIIFFENLKGRAHSENLGIDGRIILEWIFGK